MSIKNNKLQNRIFILLAIVILVLAILKLLGGIKNDSALKQVFLQDDMEVILYVKKGCSYCNMAKEFLTKNQIAYEVIDLSFDLDLQKKLVLKTGQTTVPYIFINNKFIGGYSNLLKLEIKK
jgi:glutaredoxin 3